MSHSFRPEYRRRPAGYRTPSPPRDAYELISPSDPNEHNNSEDLWLGHKKRKCADTTSDSTAIANYHPPAPSSHNAWISGKVGTEQQIQYLQAQNAQRNDIPPIHHQFKSSQSPLDVFATVATSPLLNGASFQKPELQISSNHTGQVAQYAPYTTQNDPARHDRSLKRSRNEVYESRSYLRHIPTNTTSHPSNGTPSGDTTMEDAELLLSFAQAAQPWHGTIHTIQRPPDPTPVMDMPVIVPNTTDVERHSSVLHDVPHASLPPTVDHIPTDINEASANQGANSGLEGTEVPEVQDSSMPGDSEVGLLHPPQTPAQQAEHIPTVKQDSVERKARVYKGWPKGKPRGPRQVPYAKRGTKRFPTKQPPGADKTESLEDNQSSDLRGLYRNHDEFSTHSYEAGPSQFDGVDAESARQRSHSTSMPNRSLEISSAVESRRRGTSVPAGVSMTFSTPKLRQRVEGRAPAEQSRLGGENWQSASNKPSESQTTLCASCNSIRNGTNGYRDFWIACNSCKAWFHHTCVGFRTEREVRDVDKFHCAACEPTCGPTTFVRKSSRAHASVDYAGLHEGKIRTSTDIPDHHYIKAFNEGTIQFLPETFPRMRPELVTAEYFERCSGFSDPVVIPAWMNPRPSAVGDAQGSGHGMPRAAQQSSSTEESQWFSGDHEYDCVPDDGQDKLDMVIPKGLTVRRVAEMYGPDEKVEVIDVKSQEGEDKRWNMRQWADYYEAKGEKPVRNVISLEVSQSKLGRLIRRPKIVRDLDLQDSVWPADEQAKGIYPKVQFYCLMSVANCYTDFHIDFGGSSVYYHILSGKKTFFFIPPKKQHLKKYEEWCLSSNQGSTFLGDETKECYRVDLSDGDTMLIPSGWIHAVWTPVDTLVIGGNFLTRMHYGMQIQINDIEKNTGVARKFRYPYFQKVLWYAVVRYLERDPVPSSVAQLLLGGQKFERKTPVYLDFSSEELFHDDNSEDYNARFYSQGEIDGLADLIRYIFRTVLVAMGKVQGITKTTQEAVQRSMPKNLGEPLEIAQTFALWAAWKRGNEELPSWAYPNAIIMDDESSTADKKISAAAIKRLERQAAHEASILATGRRSSARQAPRENGTNASPQPGIEPLEARSGSRDSTSAKGKASAAAARRLACDACRHRRIRCKHREGEETLSDTAGRFGVRQVRSPTETTTKEEPASPARAPSSSRRSTFVGVVINSSESTSHHNPAGVVVDAHATAFQPDGDLNAPTLLDQDISANMKRARTKACDECRKSKRRCIHDENGLVDPVKAQEPPIPRGPHGSKRPRVDGEIARGALKKARNGDSVSGIGDEGDADSLQQELTELEDDAVRSQWSESASAILYDPEHPPIEPDTPPLKLEQDSPAAQYKPEQPYDPELVPDLDFEEQELNDNELRNGDDITVAVQAEAVYADKNDELASFSVQHGDQAQHALAQNDLPPSREDANVLSNAGSRKPSDDISTTPSLRLQTTSNESLDASQSPPSTPPMSPLTDLGPSSPPALPRSPVQVKDADEDELVSPLSARQTPRQRKQVERYSETRFDTKLSGRRQPSLGRQASLVPSPSAVFVKPAPNRKHTASRSVSHEIKAESHDGLPATPGYVRVLSDAEKREEEDIKLARELSGQEFGLRRRSK